MSHKKKAPVYTLQLTNLLLKTIFLAVIRICSSCRNWAVQPVFHSSALRLIKSKILLTKPPSVTLSRAWVILVVPIRC